MKIHAWNILAGGGTRLDKILKVIRKQDAETLVLGEVSLPRREDLEVGLAEMGYKHRTDPKLEGRARGVMIASRLPFNEVEPSCSSGKPGHRWAEVVFTKSTFAMAGLYFPDKKPGIVEFWKLVHEASAKHRDNAYLMVGDFNSGQDFFDSECDPFSGHAGFSAMPHFGMTDLWRKRFKDAREYTWMSPKRGGRRNGYRLDHAFGTKSLARWVRNIRYSHTERQGPNAASDHSSLLLDVWL